MKIDLADAETFRLVKAFNQIADPQTRRMILSIAEAAARGSALKMDTLTKMARSDRSDRHGKTKH